MHRLLHPDRHAHYAERLEGTVMGLIVEGSLVIISCVFTVAMLSIHREKTRPDTQDELDEIEFWRNLREGEL
jgi:hypothetical protein